VFEKRRRMSVTSHYSSGDMLPRLVTFVVKMNRYIRERDPGNLN
jgi:hypothetical protein